MSTCIISFSSRANGNCSQVGKLLCSLIQDAVLFDFSEFEVHPCGKCDYDCFTSRDKCPYIGDMEYHLLDAVTNSERTYFILPNYCDYPCTNFFIFNERSQCYFQGRSELLESYEKVPKRFVVISNTNEENFKQALAYHTKDEPIVLFLSAKRYGKTSIQGDLLTNEKVMTDIVDFIKIKHGG